MATLKMAGNGFGGIVEGNYGTYQADSSGLFTVDTRDISAMLGLGLTYVAVSVESHNLPIAPLAATIGAIVASGALSNGTVTVTANPTVMRPVNIEIGTGTAAITAGTVTVTYVANDGLTTTDVISAIVAAGPGSTTQGLSKGVVTITSITAAGLVGGTSPWIRASTTASISLPVRPSMTNLAILREYDAGATVAIGTLAATFGSVTPTTAPNGTVTYSFLYSYLSPTS